jgi:hypothetical protein
MLRALPWWTYSAVGYFVFILGFMALILWGIAG